MLLQNHVFQNGTLLAAPPLHATLLAYSEYLELNRIYRIRGLITENH